MLGYNYTYRGSMACCKAGNFLKRLQNRSRQCCERNVRAADTVANGLISIRRLRAIWCHKDKLFPLQRKCRNEARECSSHLSTTALAHSQVCARTDLSQSKFSPLNGKSLTLIKRTMSCFGTVPVNAGSWRNGLAKSTVLGISRTRGVGPSGYAYLSRSSSREVRIRVSFFR